jgi:hypothetical protein
MASIIREVRINASADAVWKVIGDFATGPSRMARGYVVDTQVDGDHRVVTFVTGAVVRERFVSVDDDARRLVYAIVDGSLQPAHDNAAMQVIPDGDHGCRLVWIHDVLPDDLSVALEASMTRGLAVIQQTLDSATTSA